jgi:hypothetical protein
MNEFFTVEPNNDPYADEVIAICEEHSVEDLISGRDQVLRDLRSAGFSLKDAKTIVAYERIEEMLIEKYGTAADNRHPVAKLK